MKQPKLELKPNQQVPKSQNQPTNPKHTTQTTQETRQTPTKTPTTYKKPVTNKKRTQLQENTTTQPIRKFLNSKQPNTTQPNTTTNHQTTPNTITPTKRKETTQPNNDQPPEKQNQPHNHQQPTMIDENNKPKTYTTIEKTKPELKPKPDNTRKGKKKKKEILTTTDLRKFLAIKKEEIQSKKLSENPGHLEKFKMGEHPSKPLYNFENSGSSKQLHSVGIMSTEVGNNSAVMGLKNIEGEQNI